MASAISAWEFANKFRLGKWPGVERVANGFLETMDDQGIAILAISAAHAHKAGLMAGAHRDPFDRMLAAQSEIEQIPLITADPAFRILGTSTIW